MARNNVNMTDSGYARSYGLSMKQRVVNRRQTQGAYGSQYGGASQRTANRTYGSNYSGVAGNRNNAPDPQSDARFGRFVRNVRDTAMGGIGNAIRKRSNAYATQKALNDTVSRVYKPATNEVKAETRQNKKSNMRDRFNSTVRNYRPTSYSINSNGGYVNFNNGKGVAWRKK